MTNEQVMDNIKALMAKARDLCVPVDAIAMDPSTWDRVYRTATFVDKIHVSMSGDHYLLGHRVLFTQRQGVQLIFRRPETVNIVKKQGGHTS